MPAFVNIYLPSLDGKFSGVVKTKTSSLTRFVGNVITGGTHIGHANIEISFNENDPVYKEINRLSEDEKSKYHITQSNIDTCSISLRVGDITAPPSTLDEFKDEAKSESKSRAETIFGTVGRNKGRVYTSVGSKWPSERITVSAAVGIGEIQAKYTSSDDDKNSERLADVKGNHIVHSISMETQNGRKKVKNIYEEKAYRIDQTISQTKEAISDATTDFKMAKIALNDSITKIENANKEIANLIDLLEPKVKYSLDLMRNINQYKVTNNSLINHIHGLKNDISIENLTELQKINEQHKININKLIERTHLLTSVSDLHVKLIEQFQLIRSAGLTSNIANYESTLKIKTDLEIKFENLQLEGEECTQKAKEVQSIGRNPDYTVQLHTDIEDKYHIDPAAMYRFMTKEIGKENPQFSINENCCSFVRNVIIAGISEDVKTAILDLKEHKFKHLVKRDFFEVPTVNFAKGNILTFDYPERLLKWIMQLNHCLEKLNNDYTLKQLRIKKQEDNHSAPKVYFRKIF